MNAHTQMGEGVDRLLTMVEDRLVDFKRNQADSYLYTPSYPQASVHVQEVLSYLTKYAGGVVFRHWKRKKRTSKLNASGTVCLCRFYCNWQLPCVHILNAVVMGRITPSEAVAVWVTQSIRCSNGLMNRRLSKHMAMTMAPTASLFFRQP